MPQLTIWLISLVALFSASVKAQTQADGITQLKQFLSQVQSAEGEFEQQQLRAPRAGEDKPKVLRKSSGHYVFKRPGQFLWETQKPFAQKVISNGQQILIWDPDLNQLSIRPIARGLAASPAALLFGEQALENVLDNSSEKKTTIILVTHKEKLLKHVDRIITVDNGRVVGDELLNYEKN